MNKSVMLGEISARELHGPWSDFMNKLQSKRSHEWFVEFKKFLREEPCWVAPRLQVGDVQRLAINYTLTLEQMIALGRYDWKNDDITAKRFPIEGSGIVDVEHKLFRFDRTVSSDEAENLIVAGGYQPGKIEHLLAYGAANPEEQRKFPIVALASVAGVHDDRRVPNLVRDGSERSLDLRWRCGDWGGYFRFLGVRNLAL